MTDLYNKTKQFEEEVRPLLDKLYSACNCLGIPMYFTAAVKNTKAGTEYVSEMLSSGALNVELNDDKLVHFIKIMNGFETHPPRQIMEIEY